MCDFYDFFNAAFSQDEQQAILMTEVDNSAKQGDKAENNTRDQVYLLSVYETKMHISGMEAKLRAPTDYAIANGAYANSMNQLEGRFTGPWWVRSLYPKDSYEVYAFDDGSLTYGPATMHFGVCPVIWIELNADIF